MARIKIEQIHPYDGEYDLDLSYFTMRELHTIKRVAGVRAGELDDAINSGDSDVVVALTVIALERAGKNGVNVDLIWDAPMGRVSLIAGDEEPVEDDAVPPPTVPPASGGVSSSPGSESPASDPSPTGIPPSDTSAISAQEISPI